MKAKEAFDKLMTMQFDNVLDIGSGLGVHTAAFKRKGKEVASVSLLPPADHIGDYLQYICPHYDCIWASHVLEHQRNVGEFLDKCYNDLKPGGILAITVPPAKASIVGGHLTHWNAGLLLYNLILAGFDCSKASVKAYGYNISVIVRKEEAVYENLIMDNGDIEKIAHLFPNDAYHGFNGEELECNW